MPSWATWRSLRQMAWHIADTESRYYLASLRVSPPERSADLITELRQSHEHVQHSLTVLTHDLVVEEGGEVWSTTKVLRRLAWHERAGVDAMNRFHSRARRAVGN